MSPVRIPVYNKLIFYKGNIIVTIGKTRKECFT